MPELEPISNAKEYRMRMIGLSNSPIIDASNHREDIMTI